MSTERPVIYLAFANNSTNPLPSLSKEEDKIREILRPREKSGHFNVEHDSFATIEKLSKNLAEFKNSLIVFHYSGHAGENELELDEGNAKAGGLAEFLGQCPKLKLVVLNGCSTKGQVRLLLEKGVPAVIATSAPVKDNSAKEFGINFYRALAATDNFLDAFKNGIAGAKFEKDDIEPQRGIKLHDQQDDGGELWGLFGEDEAVQAKLPTGYVQVDPNFEPNSQIIESLVRGMGFLPEFKDIIDREERGREVPIGTKREMILAELPNPISDPLRKLFLVSLPEDTEHYDQKTPERIRQMLLLHKILNASLAFIVLSELWDARLAREDLSLPPEARDKIIAFLQKSSTERDTKDYFKIAGLILDFMKDKKPGYYVQELNGLAGIFQEDHPVNQANDFLTDISSKGDPDLFDQGEVEYFAVEGEKKLALIMEHFSFLARYNIVSIVGIDVEKDRSLTKAIFVHRIVNLVVTHTGVGEEEKELDVIMETNSILIIRKESVNGTTKEPTPKTWKPFLNLTPFVIDKNALLKDKATKTQLYFFGHLDLNKEQITYWKLFEPTDTLEINKEIKEERNAYRVLGNQFKEFFKLFSLTEPMHENTV